MSMNTNTKYKNIIFDLGGVLINWNPRQLIQEILKDENASKYKVSPDDLMEMYRSSRWNDFDRGTISKENLIEYFSKTYKINADFFHIFYKKIYKHLFPLSEGLKLLNKIKSKGYKTYVLSNFSQDLFETVSPTYDFLDSFDGAIISYKVKTVKPEPEIYQLLLKNYNLKADECLFLDDKEENILGAKVLGIDGILYKDCDKVCKMFEEKGIL